MDEKKYLYLDFFERLNQVKGIKDSKELYTTTLTDQYNSMRRRLRGASRTFESFVYHVIVPDQTQKFALSLPMLRRQLVYDDGGKLIRNIVVRPYRTIYSDAALSPEYDVIFIGDVRFVKNMTKIVVKGMELIDAVGPKEMEGEKEVSCCAVCSFSPRTINAGGRFVDVAQFDRTGDDILTENRIKEICDRRYPISEKKDRNGVPRREKVEKKIGDLEDYLKFREYYLGKLSERCEPVARVEACRSYMVSKDVYRNNREECDGHLLDGDERFALNDQVILDEQIPGAEPFPLIRVDIEKNYKEVMSDLDKQGRRKYDAALRRYSRDSVELSEVQVRYSNGDESGKKADAYQYPLGERYEFFVSDPIKPDMSDLDSQEKNELEDEYRRIDLKYLGIIESETLDYIKERESEIDKKNEVAVKGFEAGLGESLDSDVAENSDEDVRKKYDSEVKKASDALNRSNVSRAGSLKKEIEGLKKKEKKDGKSGKKPDGDASLKKRIGSLQKELEDLKEIIAENAKKAEESVDLRRLYIERNSASVEKMRAELDEKKKNEIARLGAEKRAELERLYESEGAEKDVEKKKVRAGLDEKFGKLRKDREDRETKLRYSIYYPPRDAFDYDGAAAEMGKHEFRFLTYDSRAEKSKLDRQRDALYALEEGYVRNPYIISYLFEPELLPERNGNGDEKEIAWFLDGLNETQKEAVKKALASESLFLLQGPPGTGKTQVIAEVCAQLASAGKKVLVSSETHKAIDNVFERLPKIPAIRPLRLIPSTSEKKQTEYSPSMLVRNFYGNICESLDKEIKRAKNIEEYRERFEPEMDKLKLDYDRLKKLGREHSENLAEKEKIAREKDRLRRKIQDESAAENDIREEIDKFVRTRKCVERCDFSKDDDVVERYVTEYEDKLRGILSSYVTLGTIPVERIGKVVMANPGDITAEVSEIKKHRDDISAERRRAELNAKIASMSDPSGNAPSETSEDYEEYRNCLKELTRLNNEKDASAPDYEDLAPTISSFIRIGVLDLEELDDLPGEIRHFKNELNSAESGVLDEIEREIKDREKDRGESEERIGELKAEAGGLDAKFSELDKSDVEAEYGELDGRLRKGIRDFYEKFSIMGEYAPGEYDEAFAVIEKEWRKIERDYAAGKDESDRKTSIYGEIRDYLSQGDVIEDDTQEYTRELFDHVNVFGMTCTSRYNYNRDSNSDFSDYGIDGLDIRKEDIDVVIIDEVSKSFLLDLMIPVLNGKTVILVGDHRQLPPVYDLKHLREKDFEGMDEEIVTKERNDEFTDLYEECVFKDLFERAPKDYKIRLDKQYRCHSQIMKVFNHFYGGGDGKGLQVGKENQDDEKAHDLTVRIGKRTIINPRCHVYFVDCDGKESSRYEGSTSKINVQEAEVVVKLLDCLNKASTEAAKAERTGPGGDRDEHLSAGVICTYGDQAACIKEKTRGRRYDGFSEKRDEGFNVSTVDDFQGDERDIIIVSMVRNTDSRNFNAEFIQKFERINVALSRARKLLIIVGSERFLTKNGMIALPDIDTGVIKRVNVYEGIIETIREYGGMLSAGDILEDEK